jgi:hypothetical protein
MNKLKKSDNMGLFSRKSDAKNYGQNVEKAFQAKDWKKVEKLTQEAMEKYPDDANAIYVSAFILCEFNEIASDSIRDVLDEANSLQPRDSSVTEHLRLEAEFAYIMKKAKEFYVKNGNTEDIPNFCKDLSLRIRDSYLSVLMSGKGKEDIRKPIFIENVGNAIRNCYTHPATWLGVALLCPYEEDTFDDYDMEIAMKVGFYQANEKGGTLADAMRYLSDPDPTKQLIGHAANDYMMYKNKDEINEKLSQILRDYDQSKD